VSRTAPWTRSVSVGKAEIKNMLSRLIGSYSGSTPGERLKNGLNIRKTARLTLAVFLLQNFKKRGQ
jgi:hypothetical protein